MVAGGCSQGTVVAKLELPPRADGTERKLGPGGWIKMEWGVYFAPTVQDQQVALGNIVTAYTGHVIDQETAVWLASAVFNVRDPKAMLQKILDEQQRQLDEALSSGPYGPSDLASRAQQPPELPEKQGAKP